MTQYAFIIKHQQFWASVHERELSDGGLSNRFRRCNGIFTICTSCGLSSKKVNMATLLVMNVEFTSETKCELANDASGDGSELYRSEIHSVLPEISHMCHLT